MGRDGWFLAAGSLGLHNPSNWTYGEALTYVEDENKPFCKDVAGGTRTTMTPTASLEPTRAHQEDMSALGRQGLPKCLELLRDSRPHLILDIACPIVTRLPPGRTLYAH